MHIDISMESIHRLIHLLISLWLYLTYLLGIRTFIMCQFLCDANLMLFVMLLKSTTFCRNDRHALLRLITFSLCPNCSRFASSQITPFTCRICILITVACWLRKLRDLRMSSICYSIKERLY